MYVSNTSKRNTEHVHKFVGDAKRV